MQIQRVHSCLLLLLAIVTGFTLVSAPVVAEDTTGFFEVTSVPSGGDVFIGSEYAGETPVLIPVRNQTGGTTLRVMMQGFGVWEQKIAGSPVPGQIVPVKAVLVPLSPYGTLEISSSPSGAMVTVDNGNGQMTPWIYRDVTTGTHLISMYLSGFDPYVANIDVVPGSITRLHANMTVRSGAGSLQVSSSPGGASVYIDGVYSGTTNTAVGNIPPGKHLVRISKAGYDDFEEWYAVGDKQVIVVSTSLSPVKGVSGGAFVVTSDPPGASVYLDEQYKGTTETGRPLELTGVRPGTHEVYLSIRNYEDYSTNVTVKAGEIIPVLAQMSPSPMPQDYGKLILDTEPGGAEIFIDEQFRGVTPATIDPVSSGNHTYRLSLEGYQNYSSSLELIPGQVLQINTVLLKSTDQTNKTPAPAVPVLVVTLLSVAFLFARRR